MRTGVTPSDVIQDANIVLLGHIDKSGGHRHVERIRRQLAPDSGVQLSQRLVQRE